MNIRSAEQLRREININRENRLSSLIEDRNFLGYDHLSLNDSPELVEFVLENLTDLYDLGYKVTGTEDKRLTNIRW